MRDADGRQLRAAARRCAAAGIEPLTLRRQGGPGADQRHRRHPRHAACSRSPTSRRCCSVADVAAAMSVEALLGTDRAFAADLIALRPQPGQAASAANLRAAARGLGDRRQPPRRRPACPGRLLAALRAAGERRRARRARRTPSAAAEAELGVGDRQPDGPPRRPGRVVRQLPRRAARPRLRLPGDRRRRGRRDRRAPHRPPARRRAARTACRRSSPTTPASTRG